MEQQNKQQQIAFVVAMTPQRVIGVDNRLPWSLPNDLRWFKQQTLHKPIIMGRKTYESIGRPLPDRDNIVLTRDPEFSAPGCVVMHSVQQVMERLVDAPQIMVIGGAAIFELFFPYANRLYLTIVEADIPGDTFFPCWKEEEWTQVFSEAHTADERHAVPYCFMTYEKK